MSYDRERPALPMRGWAVVDQRGRIVGGVFLYRAPPVAAGNRLIEVEIAEVVEDRSVG